MVDRRQHGFTVIEVLMFLAISGLLLMGAIASFNGSINNTRFNDAANSTTSFLQKQYAQVVNGQNIRSDDLGCVGAGDVSTSSPIAPGMSNCVVLGRLLHFQPSGGPDGSVVTSRYIVGAYSPTATGSDSTVLATSSLPKAVNQDALNSSFEIPWATEVKTMRRVPSNTPVNYLAIVRSPVSDRVLIYSFFNASPDVTQLQPYMTNANLNQSVALCISDDRRIGYIRIGAGQGQDIVRTDLSNTSGVCA